MKNKLNTFGAFTLWGILLIILFLPVSACKKETKSEESPYLLTEHLVNSVLWFRKSAEMKALYYQCYETAKHKLRVNLEKSTSNTPKAVVLDIDETVLDNSPYEVMLIKKGESYSSDTWRAWTDSAAAEVLPGAEDFLHFADSLGVEVFYISNRKVVELDGTLQNLKKYNLPYVDKDHILLRTEEGDKTARRKKAAEGREVLLYIGDNLTDFSNEFAERGSDLGFNSVEENRELLHEKFVMLPNPMYGEWEKAVYGNTFELTDEEKIKARKEALSR